MLTREHCHIYQPPHPIIRGCGRAFADRHFKKTSKGHSGNAAKERGKGVTPNRHNEHKITAAFSFWKLNADSNDVFVHLELTIKKSHY